MPPIDRVSVRGTSGSGKSTFACALAERIAAPCFELDSLFWLPGWEERTLEDFRAQVAAATSVDRWVVDGNYSKVQDLVGDRADTIIWLDYPFPVVLRRVVIRTFRRAFKREPCCNGNYERPIRALFHPDSIVWWTIKTHRRRHRECEAVFSGPTPEGKRMVRLSTSWDALAFLSEV